MTFGENVEVEEHLVDGIFGVAFAKVDRVLLAFLGAREIEIAAEAIGNGKIGLLDPSEHFLVELFLEGFGAGEDRVGVGVFGVQIGDDFGILLIVEPSIGVDAAVVVNDVFDGMATSDGWGGRRDDWRGDVCVGFGSHEPLAKV